MQRKDMYFSVDCEMVGVGPGGLDSALARVSVINFDNEIVLDTYVRVEEEVIDYRTFVSGIRPEHIESESAMNINQVRTLVGNILTGKILVGHALENDLKVLGLEHPDCDIRDTAKYEPFMRHIQKENDEMILCPRKLKDLVWEHLSKHIQVMGKAHSPVEDAIAAMDLYKGVRSEWEVQKMQEVNRVSPVPFHHVEPAMQDSREQAEPLRTRRMGRRVGVDPGSQYLFSSRAPQQCSPHAHHVPQFVTPMAPMTHSNFAPMGGVNSYHASASSARLASARRTQDLARARVVAALHQQRMRWHQQQQQHQQHQQQQQYHHQQQHQHYTQFPVYVDHRMAM